MPNPFVIIVLKTLRESSPQKVRHDSGETAYRPSQLATPPGRELSLSGPRNRHSGRTGRKRALQPNRKDTYHMIAHTIKRIVCLGCLSLAAADMSARDRALEKSIRTFLRDRQATVTVAVLNDGRMIASIEEKAELPTMSVFKFYQALAVLDPAGRVRPVAGQSPLLRGEPAASGHAQSAEGFHSAGRHSGGPRPDPLRTDRQRQQCVRHSAGRSGRTRGRRSLCPAAGYPGRYDRSDGANHARAVREPVSQPHDGRSGRPDAGATRYGRPIAGRTEKTRRGSHDRLADREPPNPQRAPRRRRRGRQDRQLAAKRRGHGRRPTTIWRSSGCPTARRTTWPCRSQTPSRTTARTMRRSPAFHESSTTISSNGNKTGPVRAGSDGQSFVSR